MNIVTLNCNGCGASLPTPTGPTITCNYCESIMALSRPKDGGADTLSIASKDQPATIWLPLSESPDKVHMYLLEHAARTELLDPSFLNSLTAQRLQQVSDTAYVFTVQAKGGFTAMAGVNETRVVQRADIQGKLSNVEVTETRWTPFSSQLRISRVIACPAGGEHSEAIVKALNQTGNLGKALKEGTEYESVETMPMSSEAAWTSAGLALFEVEQRKEAELLMQGDEFKTVKYNMDIHWQPVVACVEFGRVESSSGVYDLMSLDGRTTLLSDMKFPLAVDRKAQVDSANEMVETANRKFYGTSAGAAIMVFLGLMMATSGDVALGILLLLAGLGGGGYMLFGAPAALATWKKASSDNNSLKDEFAQKQVQEVATARTAIAALYDVAPTP